MFLALAAAWVAAAPVELVAEVSELKPDTPRPVRLEVRLLEPAVEVVLTASAGRVDGLTRVSPTRYIADWSPPKQSWPDLVLLAAVARSDARSAVALLRVPMWGQGVAKAAGRVGQKMVLEIGGRRYGPAVVGADSIAEVPFEAAPHETTAWVGSRSVDLALPSGRDWLVTLDHSSVEGGGGRVLARLARILEAPGGKRNRIEDAAHQHSPPEAVSAVTFAAGGYWVAEHP